MKQDIRNIAIIAHVDPAFAKASSGQAWQNS